MRFSTLIVLGLVHAATASSAAGAQSLIDPDARVVDLRVSCALPDDPAEPGVQRILDNCFETSGEVTDWLWGLNPREPNALDPVTVRVGPGTFDRFECEGTQSRGFVSVEGAGRDLTRFVSDDDTQAPPLSQGNACRGGVTSLGCSNLSFRNITAQGIGTGVLWTGSGESQWQDVDMFASNQNGFVCRHHALAWYDVLSSGVHFFWNTRFEASGDSEFTVAFFNAGAEAWIYGSDFLVHRDGPTATSFYTAAVRSISAKGTRIFGSSVRAKVEPGSAGASVVGLETKGSGVIHIHGGIVNVDASAHQSGIAFGVLANSGGFVHTPDTAFNLAGRTKARLFILGSGTIKSPFLWPSDTTLPQGDPNPGEQPVRLFSLTGADLFVKTNEGPSQNEPRLLIYDSSCSPDPWRDTTTGNCF